MYSATGKWESKDSFSLSGTQSEDHILWANVSSKASDYVDSRGYLSAMATISLPPLPQFTGYMETDYVAL